MRNLHTVINLYTRYWKLKLDCYEKDSINNFGHFKFIIDLL